MRGRPAMRALTAYDHWNHHEAKINSHPVYATTRSGPEPVLVNKATAWLQTLRAVPYFATDRIGNHHAWAKIESGGLTRAYCYTVERGEVPLHIGEPTGVETELGVGQRWLEGGWQDWQQPEWDAWFAAAPRDHVMRIARAGRRRGCRRPCSAPAAPSPAPAGPRPTCRLRPGRLRRRRAVWRHVRVLRRTRWLH